MLVAPRIRLPEISPTAARFGYSAHQTRGHMARSMMLAEVSLLTRALSPEARAIDYKNAILSGNILGKPTFSSRNKSYRHLKELYGLSPDLPPGLLRRLAGMASTQKRHGEE
jgi:hypothetical protein